MIEVQPDSPAAKAGLRPTQRDESNRLHLGDVIVAFDGKPVRSANDVFDFLEEHKAGDAVQVTVLRDGKEQKLTATLEAKA